MLIKDYYHKIFVNTEVKDFLSENKLLALSRLKIVSLGLVLIYGYYLYCDFILFNGISDSFFRYTLAAIHLFGFILSICYLFFYSKYGNNQRFTHSKWSTFIINFYITMYIFMGLLASLNSQRLTGNIDAYIIILISVAVLFPIRPNHFLTIVFANHVIFILLLSNFSQDPYSLVSKQINTTATVLISCLISFTFFVLKKEDFLNQLRLKENEENLNKLFRINPLPLFLVNQSNGQILMSNNAVYEHFNITEIALSKRDIGSLLNIKEDWTNINNKLKHSKKLKNYMVEQLLNSESSRWILLNIELIDYKHEDCLLIGLTDITELKRIENELTIQASIDPLTGVHNRRFGIEFLQNLMSRVEIEKIEFTLCFIDINHLKVVNDRFGHPEGDNLIQAVCNVIKHELNVEDILFRFGGDEFIVIFFSKTLSEVDRIWESIIYKLDHLNYTSKKPYHISASHGFIHIKPGMDATLDEILDKADKEMYKEKASLKPRL